MRPQASADVRLSDDPRDARHAWSDGLLRDASPATLGLRRMGNSRVRSRLSREAVWEEESAGRLRTSHRASCLCPPSVPGRPSLTSLVIFFISGAALGASYPIGTAGRLSALPIVPPLAHSAGQNVRSGNLVGGFQVVVAHAPSRTGGRPAQTLVDRSLPPATRVGKGERRERHVLPARRSCDDVRSESDVVLWRRARRHGRVSSADRWGEGVQAGREEVRGGDGRRWRDVLRQGRNERDRACFWDENHPRPFGMLGTSSAPSVDL